MAACTVSSALAEDGVLEVHQQNGIAYVSGGIGDDETTQLEATQHNYNLRVMNTDRSGHFSGDTRIVISDLQHHALLDTESGPLLYANLPKGRYIVEGFTASLSKKQAVVITAAKSVRVHFVWPEDSAQ